MINNIKTMRRIAMFVMLILIIIVPVQTASAIDSVLTPGDRGGEVENLQTSLTNAGFYPGYIDGIFGRRTLAAVLQLQEQTNILIDGIVGPQTQSVIDKYDGSNTETNVKARVVDMIATAYDNSNECNYPWGGYPSYIGLPLRVGIVAVDPAFIPLGTRLYVEGYGEAIAADTGNAIKGNRIDLFYPTHQSASDFGIRNVKVQILD